MGDDEIKRIILARRARFVAAAIASVAAAAAADGCAGGSGPLLGDGGTTQSDASPEPCLSPRQDPPDGGDKDDGAIPQPCLSRVPPDSSF